MKPSYKKDLKNFYSKKSAIDKKMKIDLKKAQGLDKKKDVIEKSKQQREEEQVDDDELNLLRTPYIRMVDYLKSKDDEIALLYENYNQFKLNILYENVNTTQFTDDVVQVEMNKFEKDIEALKLKKNKQIIIINEKKEVIDKTINELKIKISERQQEYNETEKIEDKKQIYIETISLKLQLFEIFRKNISIVNIESKTNDSFNKYSTIVIDYLPIKDNQKRIGEFKENPVEVEKDKENLVELGVEELGVEELGVEELGVDELGVDELGEIGPPSPQYRASEHFNILE